MDSLSELQHVLTVHAERYPLMRPTDAVKLVFQNEMGGGHLIADARKSLERLCTEVGQIPFDSAAPLFEDIGNGLGRVMLAGLDPRLYTPEQLNADFVRSAQHHQGDPDMLRQKLDVLRKAAAEGLFAFSATELDDFLGPYMASGCPAVSHSPEYRTAYRPAYRIAEKSLSLAGLIDEVCRLAQGRGPLVIAIDGRCASGKTTLAGRLHDVLGWSVVHMDDFFLRPEQRTPERYATPGENVDHERFLSEVLRPLRAGQPVEYRPFDCHIGQLGAPVRVSAAPVTVVEGSYSCHPSLRSLYDLRVFVTIEPDEQLRRIEARNGGYAEVFRTRWIPLEEQYFSACGVEDCCEFTLTLV